MAGTHHRPPDGRSQAPPGRPLGGDPPNPASVDRELRSLEVLPGDVGGGSALRRAVVDAYDRFADRVLGRMRAMHEDVDADLAELRSEVASLRQAVDDVGDRVQLRQLRAAIDELRSDVTGLRRAVLEWPELERVSADVTAIRADLAVLAGSGAGSDGLAGDDSETPLQAELAALRAEMTALRRRIAVRAGGSVEAELGPEQVDALAERLIERLLAAIDPDA